jgi:hypothetical protein
MPRPLRAVVKIAGRIGASQQWHHQRIPWPRGTLQAGAFDGSAGGRQPENVSLCAVCRFFGRRQDGLSMLRSGPASEP